MAGQGDRAVHRDPAHQLRIQEVPRLAADLPDPLVLLPPAGSGGICGRGQEPPGYRVQFAELVDQPLRSAEQLTVHVELPLEPCAVADPDRPAAPPARQMWQLPLGQVPLAANAEHDLQVRAALRPGGGRIGKEGEELVRLVWASRHPQGLHGQAGVAHPGVAVVPVPLAADSFRQRGGRRRHDRARRREGHGLQHAPGMTHQLTPRPLIILVNR
jgi:hypothetical protein